MTASADALAIVIVSYNSAAHLAELLEGVIEQMGDDDEIVVVDNDSSDDGPAIAASVSERIQVIQTGANLGFGGGCHVGAQATTAPLLAFVNPDSQLDPGCLQALRQVAAEHPEWAAWQAAVLTGDGRINTDGGVVHYTGIGWAGHCGAPVSTLASDGTEVAFPSGAATTIRRTAWDTLGGFDVDYFMYCEDSDLGLRLWLAGHAVGLAPAARLRHAYDFDKGNEKWFYLERNRLRTVLSVYPGSLLALLTPALVMLEFALLGVAVREGWLGAKLRADAAVLREATPIRRRRRRVQATRQITTGQFAARLTASLDSEFITMSDGSTPGRLQAAYWRLVRAALSISAR